MLQELRPALLALLVLTLITGLLYPLAVTAVAQTLFRERANGSLIRRDDAIVGSHLIGQSFDDPRYFWGRLSATAPAYNGGASSGSNHGPLHPALREAVIARATQLAATDGEGARARVPVDLVTASGSGLDPHVSPAAARCQIVRVARARGLSVERVAALVDEHVEERDLFVLGEPRVHVLRLNLALDAVR